MRRCACPCRRPFVTTRQQQRYIHPSHYPAKGSHYTANEKRQRQVLLANPPNGQRCPRCGRPMTRQQWTDRQLHTGHIIDRINGGADHGFRWEHATCNMAAGGALSTPRQRGDHTRSRNW